jgi:twitching motility protein PilU
MVDYRNRQASGHIVTIEDPLGFVQEHKKSIINQRDVGVDTRNWHNALKNTLRQAPDVVLIGEIRDRETMEHALAFAETGLLCISTLHANNANQALDRIVNFFPDEKRQQLLMDLSLNMQAFVSQRLILNSQGGWERRRLGDAGISHCEGVDFARGYPWIERDHGEIKGSWHEDL